MAFNEATEDNAFFPYEFVADEILARLPARCAVRCTVLSKRFRQLLTSPHFWLRHRRLGAPLELPHAARIQCQDDCKDFSFHVVGPTFVIELAFSMEHRNNWYASTCNGLVLVSGPSYSAEGHSSVDGVVFNPATKEEARLSLQLPHPGKEDVGRQITGFGYVPSSNVYKALICEVDDNSLRLMVLSLDDNGGQEPRTVFSWDDNDTKFYQCLHTADGKVDFLIDEDGDMSVLAFDFDSEAVTRIAVPEGQDISEFMMLEVRGRLCIYAEKGEETVLWLLTADHRWEQPYILVKEGSQRDDSLKGVWDCGGGFLFAEFKCSGAYMYNLNEAAGEEKEGSRLTAVSSLKFEHKWPGCNCSMNLSDYQPTLISPASILGDAAFSYRCRDQSVAPKHEVDGTFLEITQKSLIDPMMLMLSVLLRPPSG